MKLVSFFALFSYRKIKIVFFALLVICLLVKLLPILLSLRQVRLQIVVIDQQQQPTTIDNDDGENNELNLSTSATTSPFSSKINKFVVTLSSKQSDNEQGASAVTLKSWANSVEKCPERSPLLTGDMEVTFEIPSFAQIFKRNPKLKPGGQSRPAICTSIQDRLAVIIPYRNRDLHLRALLNHLHPILQRQQLDYTIFVVEQANNNTFNKALLMNAAFQESRRLGAIESQRSNYTIKNYECYVFHDVDLFAESDLGIYKCGDFPLHISEYVDKFNYQSWSGADVLYGGVVSIKRNVFEMVNGYSNIFFGWGGEDEEMRMRLRLYNIPIEKPDKSIYRYQMIRHDSDNGNPWNHRGSEMIGETSNRMYTDGLNSLRYSLVDTQFPPTHTHLFVNFTREEVYEAVFGVQTFAAQSYVTSGV